jgi:Kef-type K+ transport system membrane component KefB/nucleotide-binding universal stress UspA family protein
MSHFTSLTEHQQLVFWTELLAILVIARLLGSLLSRFGQPAVVGELGAGLVLGPSVLGKIWPGGFDWLFPADKVQSGAVTAIGWLGIALLLVLTGFETDLDIIRRLGRAAGSVAAGALLIPFGAGIVLGSLLPHAYVGAHTHRDLFVLFMGVGLSISSLPVIAKILGDLGLMRRNFGQVTVAVGMVNDLVGWLALGVISGLATSAGLSAGHLILTVGSMAILLGGGLTVGQKGVDLLLRAVRSRSEGALDSLVVTILVVVAVAAAAQGAGIEAVLGAYVAGIVIGRSRFRHPDVGPHLESITYGILAPVFFASAGLKLDLGSLSKPSTALWCALVIVIAVGTKFGGAYLGARGGGLPNREALALGSALNARGAVEVVIATVGLSLGVLSEAAFTVIVLMAIITSVMAPPLLKLVIRGWSGTEEERQRLDHEQLLESNLLVKGGRLLLPSRGRPNSIVAAQIMQLAWPDEVGVTVVSIHSDGEKPDLEPIASVFAGREVEYRRVSSEDALDELLREARLGYQAIGLGAADQGGDRLLSPVVDEVLADSPIPLVIVRRARRQSTRTPFAFARALVPVSGSPSSRSAQEVAFSLSARLGTQIVLVHVVNRPDDGTARSGGVADAVLVDAMGVARQFDVEPRSLTRSGTSTGEEILAAAVAEEADLVVLGATVRRLDGRPFLGHTVEHILDQAEMTVVVVTSPDPTADPNPAGQVESAAEVSGESPATAGAGAPSPGRGPKSPQRGRRG